MEGKIGNRNYITNSDSSKGILIEITKVEVKKFCEIDEDHAKKEGEEFNKNILLFCEEFKVINDNK